MSGILEQLSFLKIFYLILIVLVMIVINVFLNKKNINSNYRYLINGISLVLISFTTSYYAEIIDSIFSFNFLSVKFYILLLIITCIIGLFTVQKKIGLIYRVFNYLLLGLMAIILGAILVIIVGVNLEFLSSSISKYLVILLNVSIIIFIIYLIVIGSIYVVKSTNLVNILRAKFGVFEKKIGKKNVVLNKDLSLDDLLEISKKGEFIINGVECSIIFEDSVPDNILKNYNILLNDINDKLVNGYTLDENKLLKSICTKLQTYNLNDIDIKNLSILNKISVEEYNFLKQLYEE